jgi:hypothetical protein
VHHPVNDTWHIVGPTYAVLVQWYAAMCLVIVPWMVRWFHSMLPHGMHMMMWWPKVLPCHLFSADMCRFAPIALCHMSLSGGVDADVDQQVSATWHVWGPPVRYPRQCGAHLCWHGPIGLWHVAVVCWPGPLWCCHVAHLLSSFIFILGVFHTQFVPRVVVVPKLYSELPWLNLSPWLIHLICFISSEFILIAPLIQ